MMEGILGAIANPQLADVAGALDYRRAQMDKDEAKRKELRMNQLIAQAIPNMAADSPVRKIFEEDPKTGAMLSKMIGIPLNDGEAWEKFRGNVAQLHSLAKADPRMAIERANAIKAENDRLGIVDEPLNKWVGSVNSAMEKGDQDGVITQFNALGVMNDNLNPEQKKAIDDAKTTADLDERKMKVAERQVAAQESRYGSQNALDAAQAAHYKAIEADGSSGLSDEAKDLLADRLVQGEKSSAVLGNIGRGAQGAADLRDIQNRFAAKAKAAGIDANKILQNTQNTYADNRTFLELGAREGKIAPRVMEANSFAKIALDASDKVPRESFVPWNKLSQYTDKQLSDPKLAAMHAATQSLVNAYASAVGGGVMTEGNRQEANRMLYDAQGPDAYKAVVNQMLVETQAALDSPKLVREHMHAPKGAHETKPSTESRGGWGIRPVK